MSWNKVFVICLAAFILVAAIAAACLLLPRCRRLNEMYRVKEQREQENLELADKTSELQSNQERFARDPAFVERTARDAGLVKPGETVFKFTNDPARATSPAPR